MAHNVTIKARAMADLLLGEATRDVSTARRVPERTIRRWRSEAWALLRASLSAEQKAELAELRAIWPGLLRQNGRSAWGGLKCNAKTRSGEPCGSPPVRGKTRCRMHGGHASGASIL
jgi:hypothetical protein